MKFLKKIKSYFKKDSSSKRSKIDAELLEKYDVGAVLGAGSFAIVKVVTRKSDNVQLACKIIDRVKFKST